MREHTERAVLAPVSQAYTSEGLYQRTLERTRVFSTIERWFTFFLLSRLRRVRLWRTSLPLKMHSVFPSLSPLSFLQLSPSLAEVLPLPALPRISLLKQLSRQAPY